MSLSRIMLLQASHQFFKRSSLPMLQMLNPSFPVMHSAKRSFASDADIKNMFFKSQVSRVSVLEPGASELIAAIRNNDYKKAELLVRNGVNVNGHTSGENTPLTDASKRGDARGVEFLLKNLKANPSASCDCPHHKTALHYASENGHTETVKVLLKYGANPNVLDSRRYTAIDVAKNEEVKVLLEKSGCSYGKQIEQDKVKLRMYLPR